LAVMLIPGTASAHSTNHHGYSDHNHPLTRKGGSYSSSSYLSNKYNERRDIRKLRRENARLRRQLENHKPLYSREHDRRHPYAGQRYHHSRLKPAVKYSKPLVVRPGHPVRRLRRKIINRSNSLHHWYGRNHYPYRSHSTVARSRF